jgi:hypothetical protein
MGTHDRVRDDNRSELHAWVDESIHSPVSGVSEGMYVLAAAVAPADMCDSTRASLRSLIPRGAARLHWRHESAPLKRKIAATITGLDFTGLVVVGVRPDGPERARRMCMERLLFELDEMRISTVWLESRTQSLNRKDQTMVAALRSKKVISELLRAEFQLPSQEPMLWLPDAIAGAVGMARKGVDVALRETMGELIELEIEIRGAP